MPTPRFALASASPRRQQLLSLAGYDFDVIPSGVHEPPPEGFASAEAYVTHLAWLKAREVAGRYPGRVLAADTATVAGADILGKAADRADAARILKRLMGTTHVTMTGVCLWLPRASQCLLACASTEVRMRELSAGELERYLDSGGWEGKAGAYGIQDKDDPFVEAIVGSYSNVVGLPMEKVSSLFTDADALER